MGIGCNARWVPLWVPLWVLVQSIPTIRYALFRGVVGQVVAWGLRVFTCALLEENEHNPFHACSAVAGDVAPDTADGQPRQGCWPPAATYTGAAMVTPCPLLGDHIAILTFKSIYNGTALCSIAGALSVKPPRQKGSRGRAAPGCA